MKLTAPRIMKMMVHHSMAALPKAAMLALRVLNPPVETVANVWHTASKTGMPRTTNPMRQTRVKPR